MKKKTSIAELLTDGTERGHFAWEPRQLYQGRLPVQQREILTMEKWLIDDMCFLPPF